ncbi:MAG: PEGA domain-containing protein [Sandaracinaceae bacterium]
MQNPFAPGAGVSRLIALASVLMGATTIAPTIVAAQDAEVVVLGIRSLEGDDEFARNLTGAVRHSASQVAGWSVSDREVTLAQMSLVHGCEEVTAACMGEIAGSLEAGRVIYGEVRRTGAGDDYDFELTLSHFSTESGTVEETVERTLPGERTDIDDVREPIHRLMSQLSGAPQVGRLLIASNVPGAEVFVDEQAVGTTDDNGQLVLEEVGAGDHQVRIRAEGHTSTTESVSVEAYGEASLETQLAIGAEDGGSGGVAPELVVGAGLLVVAAAAAGLWIWSMTEVLGVNNNDQYRMADGTVDGFACNDPSVRAMIADQCDTGTTHEVLQFVFLGVGALSVALGAYLVLEGLNGDADDAESASLRVVPAADQNGGYLTLDGAF